MPARMAAILMSVGVLVLCWLLWQAYPMLERDTPPQERRLFEIVLGLTGALGVLTLVVCWLAWR